MSSSILHREFIITSDLEGLKRCLILCQEIKDSLDINVDKYFAVQTSLLEAVHNAIKHGNKNRPDKKIRIEVDADNSNVDITVEDEGDGFNPDAVPDPTTEERRFLEHGRGIFLIKNLCDEFNITGRGNIVKLQIHY
jgi:serine/threonine-protein kinase RsbW